MTFFFYLSSLPLLICLYILFFLKHDLRSARYVVLSGLVVSFVFECFAFPLVNFLHEGELPTLAVRLERVILLVAFFLTALLTPSLSANRKLFLNIAVLPIIALAGLLMNEFIPLILLLAVTVVVFLFTVNNSRVRRLLTVYGVVVFLLFLAPYVFPQLKEILFVTALVLIIGCFPISAWYSKFFEKIPSGMIASMVIMQLVFATKLPGFLISSDVSRYLLVIFAVLSALRGALQPDIRRSLAGLAASQISFLAYGYMIPFYNLETGQLFLTSSLLIATPGLILSIGNLESRVGKLKLYQPHGNYSSYPRLANTILIFGLLSASFPLSLGYFGEDILLSFAFHREPILAISWLAVIALNAVSALKYFFYLCQGGTKFEPGIDMKPMKYIISCLCVVFLFVSAFFFNH